MRFSIAALTLMASLGSCAAQETLPTPGPVISIVQAGTDVERATQLRLLLSGAKPGTALEFETPQTLDFGDTLLKFPPGVLMSGPGGPIGEVRLECPAGRVSAQGCVFELQDGDVFTDLTFASTCRPDEQSQTIGFHGRFSSTNATATVQRCRLFGRSFVAYIWGNAGNTLKLQDDYLEGGKWIVTAGGGGGPTWQTIKVVNSTLVADFERWRGAGGDQGQTQAGIVARGGSVTMEGGSISCRGSREIDQCYGVWATAQPSPPGSWGGGVWPLISLWKVECKVDPNGSPAWCDARADIGQIVINGGRGSGPNGEWIVAGNVAVYGAAKIVKTFGGSTDAVDAGLRRTIPQAVPENRNGGAAAGTGNQCRSVGQQRCRPWRLVRGVRRCRLARRCCLRG